MNILHGIGLFELLRIEAVGIQDKQLVSDLIDKERVASHILIERILIASTRSFQVWIPGVGLHGVYMFVVENGCVQIYFHVA